MATTQVGNLVGPASNAVTTVSTLDPIKANFTVSEQEYLSLTRRDATHEPAAARTDPGRRHRVSAQRAGSPSPTAQVNQTTGAIQLTGLFPNPGIRCGPASTRRCARSIGMRSGALLVPQRAVTELQGNYQVAVVDAEQ